MKACHECGMPVEDGEYHPYAACLMFKACHDSKVVRMNLDAVLEREREACAKICDEMPELWNSDELCAAAIRARNTS